MAFFQIAVPYYELSYNFSGFNLSWLQNNVERRMDSPETFIKPLLIWNMETAVFIQALSF